MGAPCGSLAARQRQCCREMHVEAAPTQPGAQPNALTCPRSFQRRFVPGFTPNYLGEGFGVLLLSTVPFRRTAQTGSNAICTLQRKQHRFNLGREMAEQTPVLSTQSLPSATSRVTLDLEAGKRAVNGRGCAGGEPALLRHAPAQVTVLPDVHATRTRCS